MTDTLGGEHDSKLARRTNAWDEFLETQFCAGFMQSSWWADIMFARGWGHFGAVIRDGETIVGGAQVFTQELAPGKSYYYVPEGPVVPEDEADGAQVFQAVLDFVDQRRKTDDRIVTHLHIEPRWQTVPGFVSGLQPRASSLEPRNTLYIDLTASVDVMLARMKPKGRYNINLARRHGVAVVEDASARGLDDFLSIYHATVARHGLEAKRTLLFDHLHAHFVKHERGSIFFAEYQGVRIAVALVVYFGRRATYFFGGSLAMHRRVMAPYLLHFHIMLNAKQRGCHWYDMYGIAPLSEPNHKWADLSSFKRKLGGTDLNFVPAMDLVYDPAAYAAHCR